MFYALSKLFWLVAEPATFSFLLIGVGLIVMRTRFNRGRAMALAGLGLMVLLGFSPVSNILLLPLEQRFADVPRPQAGEAIAGIIMLGGFEDGEVSLVRKQFNVNEAGERMLETLLLARRFPDAKVIFTGGTGNGDAPTGARAVLQYLLDSGIAPGRIVIEGKSRTTYENALFLKDLLQPLAGKRFVLVTSAFHMPRAVGVFRHQGYELVPYPVDFRTSGPGDAWVGNESAEDGLHNAAYAIKEWVGLAAYRFSGRTDAFWPEP